MSEEDGITETIDNSNDEFKAKCIESFIQIRGVGRAVAEKIYDAQYYSLMDIGASPVDEFVERTNVAKATAEKFIANARALANIGEAHDLTDYFTDDGELPVVPLLSTGCSEANALIGGGLKPKAITEIFGENGAGKTQFCFTTSVMATRPIEEGGLDGYVVYVDTEGTFSPRRMKEIIEARGYDFAETAKRIIHIKATSTSHQIVLMDMVREIATTKNVKLLVVDSIIAHFRAEYVSRGALSERQQLLGKYLADLKKFAEANDCVVLVTNQVSARPDSFFFGDPNIQVGGNVLGHAVSCILKIRKGKSGRRVIGLIKSPEFAPGEAVADMNEKGFCDVKPSRARE